MKADEFKLAFLETWNKRIATAEGRDTAIAAYQRNPTWTQYMLGAGDAGGLLHEVASKLNRTAHKEFFALDCVYYQDEFRRFEGGGFPIGFDAIIEHENEKETLEQEWYKLLLWQAPLNVLIFYDYNEEQRQNNPVWANWLVGKLETFADMTRQMRTRRPGRRDEGDYLVVVGYVPAEDDLPIWRWL